VCACTRRWQTAGWGEQGLEFVQQGFHDVSVAVNRGAGEGAVTSGAAQVTRWPFLTDAMVC
jgi:hypothetical protein